MVRTRTRAHARAHADARARGRARAHRRIAVLYVAAALIAGAVGAGGYTAAAWESTANARTGELTVGLSTFRAAFGADAIARAEGTDRPEDPRWYNFKEVDYAQYIDDHGSRRAYQPTHDDYRHLVREGFVNIPIRITMHTSGNRVVAPVVDAFSTNWDGLSHDRFEPRWTLSTVDDLTQCAPDRKVELSPTWNRLDDWDPSMTGTSLDFLSPAHYSTPPGSNQGLDVTINLCLRGLAPRPTTLPACAPPGDPAPADHGIGGVCGTYANTGTVTYTDGSAGGTRWSASGTWSTDRVSQGIDEDAWVAWLTGRRGRWAPGYGMTEHGDEDQLPPVELYFEGLSTPRNSPSSWIVATSESTAVRPIELTIPKERP